MSKGMSLHDEAVRKVTGSIYAAAWRQITPDEATKQIMDEQDKDNA